MSNGDQKTPCARAALKNRAFGAGFILFSLRFGHSMALEAMFGRCVCCFKGSTGARDDANWILSDSVAMWAVKTAIGIGFRKAPGML